MHCIFIVIFIFEELFCADLFVSDIEGDCMTVSSPCNAMFNISKLITDQNNSIYLMQDATLIDECLANFSLSWMSANCEDFNPVIYPTKFCLTSQISLIMAYIDFDLSDFSLNRPLISGIGNLELYFMDFTGGKSILGLTDSLICMLLTTTITFSGCRFSNIYFYCDSQIIYISLKLYTYLNK
jgi:hypothetical protein